ncbi:YhgE/Pip domain-containing protein [Actinomadura flavalba]|uniref:YhgE/Pip domain-containing protein n=1 Tax=Actinomadura flavalba TaxID=1120938 RepID=UPI00036B90C5|nr:YhgE/Pip domain-containing protein [Actinomadura flavalba]
MRALRLGVYELLRFRTPLQRAGLAFLLVVPLMYGAIYLWSNWDPYARLDQVPVAVVNEDRAVNVEGRTVDAGADVVAQFRANPLLGWRFTGAGDARDGLRDGRYYAVITIPSDFSAKLTSGANGTPEQAAMSIRLDDANNYLVGVMARTVQAELERQIAAAAVAAYFETAFGELAELRGGLGDAASGAGELRDGLGAAKRGSASLVEGLGAAEDGSGRLVTGLDQAKRGTGALVTGAEQAQTGVGALADGLGAARRGSGELVAGLGRAGQGSSALVAGLTAADTGTAALVTGLDRLKAGTGALAPGAAELSRGLNRLSAEAVPLAERASAALPGLAGTAAAAANDATELTGLAASVSARVATAAADVDAWLRDLAARHPDLARGAPYARLRAALARLDGTVAQRVRELAAAHPAAERDPGRAAALDAAQAADAALLSRLRLLAARHPALNTDPVFAGVLDLADGAAADTRRIADLAAGIDGRTRRVAADVTAFRAQVPALQARLGDAVTGLRALDAGAARLATGARRVDDGAAAALTGATALRSGGTRLLDGARQLDAGNARLLDGARKLDAGNTRLADGAADLGAGSARLLDGARALDSGNARLLDGARQLDAGNTRLLDGARTLDSGNAKLRDGAAELASGLDSAVGQIPSLATDDQAATAERLANPVHVATSNAHPAGPYGRGLAPFFIAIALWVFGIVAFLMLRPVSGRLLASRAPSVTVAFAAWLPVAFLGVCAALLLFTVLTAGLGLDAVHTLGTIGVMTLGVLTFSSLVHLLRLAFGAAGDAVALVLLMVQLVSCGGLYPVETLPQPFRFVHDVVPMTYFVEAMRAMISGGQIPRVLRDVGVLAGFLTAALCLVVFTVHRQRQWTLARLKPELEL